MDEIEDIKRRAGITLRDIYNDPKTHRSIESVQKRMVEAGVDMQGKHATLLTAMSMMEIAGAKLPHELRNLMLMIEGNKPGSLVSEGMKMVKHGLLEIKNG